MTVCSSSSAPSSLLPGFLRLFKAYELFGRESNTEDASLEIMIDFPSFTPKRRRDDDDDDFEESPNGGQPLLLLNLVEA